MILSIAHLLTLLSNPLIRNEGRSSQYWGLQRCLGRGLNASTGTCVFTIQPYVANEVDWVKGQMLSAASPSVPQLKHMLVHALRTITPFLQILSTDLCVLYCTEVFIIAVINEGL